MERRVLMSAYVLGGISFAASGSGVGPESNVIVDALGNLIGTTSSGGADGHGAVFGVAHGATSIAILASFDGTDGADPQANLVTDSSGDIFGSTSQGGANGDGVIFEIAHGTSTIAELASFDGVDGAIPNFVTLDSSGDLFGTAYHGGASGDGTVFEIVHGTSSITTVASFDSATGANPLYGVAIDSSGDLFGTTSSGDGTVFEIPHGASSIATVASFNFTNGASPANVVLDSSGNLFATTGRGGPSGDGTIFEIGHGATSIDTLAQFNSVNGYGIGIVNLDSSGDLVGTTNFGGADNVGTVFELPHGASTIAVLAQFNSANGGNPYSGLTSDSSGDLFGTTEFGGASSNGVVFEMAPDKTPPTAAISAPNVTTAGGSTENVQIVYSDPLGVSATSIVSGNITVTGPAGSLTVTGGTIDPSGDAPTITAIYNVTAPTGGWSAADNGTYTVSLLSGQVTDIFGLAAAAAQSTFTVNIANSAVQASVTAANVTSALAAAPVNVVYADSQSSINASTIAASNVVIVAPDGEIFPVTLKGVSGSGASVTATYLYTPTAGLFTPAVNGTYTVEIIAGAVKDQDGNAVVATSETFAIDVPSQPAQDLSAALAGVIPSSVVATTPLVVREKLSVTAPSAVKGSFAARLLLSPDGNASDSVLTLASTSGKLNLKAGRQRIAFLRFPRTIPASVGPGTYHVLIQFTDAAGVVSTLNSGQTINVVAPVVDLSVASIRVPASIKAGKRFTATVLVTNTASANVAAIGLLPINLDTSSDGSLSAAVVLVSRSRRINLRPGRSIRIAITLTIAASGSTNLLAQLDPAGAAFTNDINPGDEVHTQSITVD